MRLSSIEKLLLSDPGLQASLHPNAEALSGTNIWKDVIASPFPPVHVKCNSSLAGISSDVKKPLDSCKSSRVANQVRNRMSRTSPEQQGAAASNDQDHEDCSRMEDD